jgi:pyruvate-formate lyase-activating enzyme
LNIAIKGIYHERTEDAPFVGALICADGCKFNCEDCINEELKYSESFYMSDIDIISRVLNNPFNQGIILAGLEWTLQPNEMFKLIELALDNNLEVILYTGFDEEMLRKLYPHLFRLPIYIKCGRYNKELLVNDYKMFGVKLASSNQKIIKCGAT